MPGKDAAMPDSTPAPLRVLCVDDEPGIRFIYENEVPLIAEGEVTVVEDGRQANAAIDAAVAEGKAFDAALVDLRMPGGVDGWGVAAHLNEVSPGTKFVICTGHGDLPEARKAIEYGATRFLEKPLQMPELGEAFAHIRALIADEQWSDEDRPKPVRLKTDDRDFVGSTPAMLALKKKIAKFAPTDASVLILGETGTGKEVVAKAIHASSKRANGPFVAVNCGALPEHLVESEFFGHRKGAFTGADQPRKGLFEAADGGTLFLDELGELPKAMQVKLLRFLESSEIRRVGENETFTVDVRIVCATNKDLGEMSREGEFREDLIYRVNTFELDLPPLRERAEDVPAFCSFLLTRLAGKPVGEEAVGPRAMELLKTHDWSGNVRELANALEHASILANGPIEPEDLPAHVTRRSVAGSVGLRLADVGAADSPLPATAPTYGDVPKTLREIEQEVILHTLDRHSGDKPATAKELGIALKTLYNKLNAYEAKRAAG
jgi:DNA-binding NtrC family response regulator